MPVLKTPLNTGPVELAEGKYYWKQIIPMDYKLDYSGRHLNFNREYLTNIMTAFKENALGAQTAFQLADDNNTHDTEADKAAGRNFDPERFRGDIIDMEVRSDGLYGKLEPNAQGLALIEGNKKLGVSASLRENYPSENGKTYPVVMRHLLGTIDPKVRNQKNWETADVALAADEDKDEEVIDLTTAGKEKEKLEVDKEEWDTMKKFMDDQKKEDEELEQLVNQILTEDDGDDEEDNSANLSNSVEDDPKFIALSNQVASAEFERRADAWRREGVPNKMIELARPALSVGNAMDIQLSNGAVSDGKAILSAMLEEAKGTIDLSAQNTHSQSQDEVDGEESDKKAMAEYFNSFGDGNHNGSMF